jgi:hypothetical protein
MRLSRSVALVIVTVALAACQSMSSVKPGDGRKTTITGKSYDQIWGATHKVAVEHFQIHEQDKTLVPSAKYHRIDDHVWNQWRSTVGTNLPPESAHRDKTNTIRFVLRPVSPDLTAEVAFNDSKQVLEFMLTSDASLAEGVGFDLDEA